MIPRFKADLGLKEIIAALSFWKTGAVDEFEKAFAEEFHQKRAVSFPYGRTGLFVLFKALGFKNEEIICPAYTCVVVPHAIVTSGNKPVFVDCQSDANMDLSMLENAINVNTKAIVFTSIFGHPVDLERINIIREKYPHILIIQDCAHSFGASWKSMPVQTVGDAAFFGLNASKLCTSIFGGMVTTNNDDLYEKILKQRKRDIKHPSKLKSLKRAVYLIAIVIAFSDLFYALVHWLDRHGFLGKLTKYYDDYKIDMPSDFLEGLTNCEARVGLVQIKKYRSFVSARRSYAAYYRESLKDVSGITFPDSPEGTTFSQIVAFVENRDNFRKQASKYGVDLGEVLEYSIPYLPAYEAYTEGQDNWPVSKKNAEKIINLPVAGIYNERRAQRTVSCMIKILAASR